MEKAKRIWGEAELHGIDVLEKAMASPGPQAPPKLRLTRPLVTKEHRRAKRKAQRKARRQQR